MAGDVSTHHVRDLGVDEVPKVDLLGL